MGLSSRKVLARQGTFFLKEVHLMRGRGHVNILMNSFMNVTINGYLRPLFSCATFWVGCHIFPFKICLAKFIIQ